jgi:hypothetical protein
VKDEDILFTTKNVLQLKECFEGEENEMYKIF